MIHKAGVETKDAINSVSDELRQLLKMLADELKFTDGKTIIIDKIRCTVIRDASTGLLACPLAHLLTPLISPLAPRCLRN